MHREMSLRTIIIIQMFLKLQFACWVENSFYQWVAILGINSAYTEVFKYTCLKAIFQNTNTCCIENSVISANGGYAHSALHVQKWLGMLIIKIFLRNYLLLHWVQSYMWEWNRFCNAFEVLRIPVIQMFLSTFFSGCFDHRVVTVNGSGAHFSMHWEKCLRTFAKKKKMFLKNGTCFLYWEQCTLVNGRGTIYKAWRGVFKNIYTTMENSMEVPLKTKNRTIIWTRNPTPGHISRENHNSKIYMWPICSQQHYLQ